MRAQNQHRERRTRWLGRSLVALVAAASAAATTLTAPQGAVADDVLSTRFRVLRPDGTPAGGANVLTSLLTSDAGWRTTVDADGWVTPGVPLDDPAVASLLTPTSRLVSVFIEIYDGYAPGDHDGAYTFVSAILNGGDPALPPAEHFDGLEGTTVTLRPAAMEFGYHTVPPILDTSCRRPGSWPPALVYYCRKETEPVQLANVPVPVGYNWGAGVDMTTELKVQHTRYVTTTIAAEAALGVGAELQRPIVEVGGDYSITEGNGFVTEWEWPARGGDGLAYAMYKAVQFKRVETYSCWMTAILSWQCTPRYVVYRPKGPTLAQPESHLVASKHDQAGDPGLGQRDDCTTYVEGAVSTSRGVTTDMAYNFAVEANPTYYEFYLHSSAKITGATSVGEQSKYTWRVSARTRKYHHIFVPWGMENVFGDMKPARCPTHHPGAVFTAAADTRLDNPAPFPPPDPDPGGTVIVQEKYTCEVHPEKCNLLNRSR